MFSIVSSVDQVSLRCSGLPKHDAAKSARVETHVLCNQGVDLFRSEIISRIGSTLACRETNIQLGRAIAPVLDDIDPCIIVEAAIATTGNIEKVPSRASCRVIELDPNKVKDRSRDC